MLLFVNLKPPRTRRFTKGSEEHLRLAPPNPTDHALFSFPIVIFRHSQETLKSGATKAKIGNLLGNDMFGFGLARAFLHSS